MTAMVIFLLHHYLHYWWSWPELSGLFAARQAPAEQVIPHWLQVGLYLTIFVSAIVSVLRNSSQTLTASAQRYEDMAHFVCRAAFWAVFFIGIADLIVSWLRVEDVLEILLPQSLATDLGRPSFRGLYLHYPLIVAAIVVATFNRSLGFIWLSLFIVLVEFLIVISRFVFSYEQAFMSDLVRFWYAALFLFASAYTLVIEGHVRVDVIYANLSEKAKARCNLVGVCLFGLPLCWTILFYGFQSQASSIISPILNFEISQSGYGMYVKYLMAGFLLIFAVSMMLQFISLFMKSCATLQSNGLATNDVQDKTAASSDININKGIKD